MTIATKSKNDITFTDDIIVPEKNCLDQNNALAFIKQLAIMIKDIA